MVASRREVPSFEAALGALGVAPGTPALVLPEDAVAPGLSPALDASVVLVDADRIELGPALAAARPRIRGGSLVLVRGKARGMGMLGGLRGRREVEDLVEPLVALGLEELGALDVRGLFGVTIVWARVRADVWR